MTTFELLTAVVGLVLLGAGLVLDIGGSLRAAAAYRRGRRGIEGGSEDPFPDAPEVFRLGWSRYRRLMEDLDRTLSAPVPVVPEAVLAWDSLSTALRSRRGVAISLLWLAWGVAAAGVVYGAGGEVRAAVGYAASGAAAAALWIAVHLTARRQMEVAEHRFFAALRERDRLIDPSQVAVLTEAGARSEAKRMERAENAQISLLERQHELLSTLGQQLAGELQPSLESALRDSLIPVLQSMTHRLERLSANVEATQRSALQEMAQSFKEQLTEGFREEFAALAKSLHEAAAWHQSVHRDLGAILASAERLSEGHVAMLRRTLQVSESVRTNAESLSRAERSLGLASDRVQATATTITVSLEETTRSVIDTLQGASTELSGQLSQLTIALNDQMEQSSEQLARRIQSISLMLQRVASDIDTLSRDQRSRPGGSFPRGF